MSDNISTELTAESVRNEHPRLYQDLGEMWAKENADKLTISNDRHLRERIAGLEKERDELKNANEKLHTETKNAALRVEVNQLIDRAHLPAGADTAVFRESCEEAAQNHGVDRVAVLIDDRRRMFSPGSPRSRQQGDQLATSFEEAMTGSL